MTTSLTRRIVAPAILALLGACEPDSAGLPSAVGPAIMAHRFSDVSAWSEPVWLGPVVNSPARDVRPVLSTDGRELYFHSDRDGGLGGIDIWLSRRAGINCPWETPMNVGPPLNTTSTDADPAFTPDMRVVFYASDRPGGEGQNDILVSRRADPADDAAWEQPVNLGQHVNTAAHEGNPWYVQSEAGGTLYFERSPGPPFDVADIYKVRVTPDGRTRGPAVVVSELSATPGGSFVPTVRADGRELIFWSTRPGGVGRADLWVSTRRSVEDAWSAPRNLGRPVNSEFPELGPALSHDGRTLLFNAGQMRGGLGQQDMWMSTRELNGDDDDDRGDHRRCG